jgi:hypothetical protein
MVSTYYMLSRPLICYCSVQIIWRHVPEYRDVQYNFDYFCRIYRSWMKCDGRQTRWCQGGVIIVLLFFLLKDVNCENSVAWVIEEWMCTQHSWTDTERGAETDDVLENDLTQWHCVHHLSHVDMQHLLGLHFPSSVCRGQDSGVLLDKPIGMDVQVVKKSRVAWNSKIHYRH